MMSTSQKGAAISLRVPGRVSCCLWIEVMMANPALFPIIFTLRCMLMHIDDAYVNMHTQANACCLRRQSEVGCIDAGATGVW